MAYKLPTTLKKCPPHFQESTARHEVGHWIASIAPMYGTVNFPTHITLDGGFGHWASVGVNNAYQYASMEMVRAHCLADPNELVRQGFLDSCQGLADFNLAGLVAQHCKGDWESNCEISIVEDGELYTHIENGHLPDIIGAAKNGESPTDLEKYLHCCIKGLGLEFCDIEKKYNEDFARLVEYFTRPTVAKIVDELTVLILKKWTIKGNRMINLSLGIIKQLDNGN